MGHYEKLYKKIKNNPKDVTFDEICTLLTKRGGFEFRNSGSNHYVFYHPDLAEHLSIPKDKPIKPVYIKKAIRMFEEVNNNLVIGGDSHE